jgi:hypothetical protein
MADITRKEGEWITDENDNNSQSLLYNSVNGDEVYFKISFGNFEGGTIGLNYLPNDPLKMTEQEKNNLYPDYTFCADSEHFKDELKAVKKLIESMTEGIKAYDVDMFSDGIDDQIHNFSDIKKILDSDIQRKRIHEENKRLAQDKNAIPQLSEADVSAGKNIILEGKTYDSNHRNYLTEQKKFKIITVQEKTIIVNKKENKGIVLYNLPYNNEVEKELKKFFEYHTYNANIDNIGEYFDNHERGFLKRLKFDLKEAMSQNIQQPVSQSISKQSEIETAKKAGYVQGVCECVAAVGDDYALGNKLLTEMKVSKKLAKEYASPETFKTLEKGIFAQKQEQKLEGQQKSVHSR